MIRGKRTFVICRQGSRDLGLPVLFLFLSMAFMFLVVQLRAEEVEVIGGIPYVKNDAQPLDGTETLRLGKLWRAGEEDDDIIFGSIVAAAIDEDGNVYLLDAQLSEVQVYSPEGEHIKTLSREGDGPGEIRRPDDLLILPDGTIGVVHFFSGRVVRFDREGIPKSTLIPGGADPTQGGLRSLRNMRFRGGNLVGCGGLMGGEPGGPVKRIQYLASFDTTGAERVRYLEKTTETEFGRREFIEKDSYFADDDRWALGPDGKVYAAADRDRYAISVFDRDGKLIRVIERQYEPRRRTQEEKDRVIESVVMIINGERVQPNAEIENFAACIDGLWVDDDGTLWVRNGHGAHDQPEGVMATYDIFDTDGRFLKQIQLACECDAREDGIFYLGDNRLLVSRGMRGSWLGMFGGTGGSDEGGNEPPPSEVICYGIPNT
jgi:hypothetical protein